MFKLWHINRLELVLSNKPSSYHIYYKKKNIYFSLVHWTHIPLIPFLVLYQQCKNKELHTYSHLLRGVNKRK